MGVTVSRLLSFKHAMHKIAEKTTIKGIIQSLKREKLGYLSIQCHLNLFDQSIQPILCYIWMCSVWIFSNFAILERIHLNFCQLLSPFHTTTAAAVRLS